LGKIYEPDGNTCVNDPRIGNVDAYLSDKMAETCSLMPSDDRREEC